MQGMRQEVGGLLEEMKFVLNYKECVTLQEPASTPDAAPENVLGIITGKLDVHCDCCFSFTLGEFLDPSFLSIKGALLSVHAS